MQPFTKMSKRHSMKIVGKDFISAMNEIAILF